MPEDIYNEAFQNERLNQDLAEGTLPWFYGHFRRRFYLFQSREWYRVTSISAFHAYNSLFVAWFGFAFVSCLISYIAERAREDAWKEQADAKTDERGSDLIQAAEIQADIGNAEV